MVTPSKKASETTSKLSAVAKVGYNFGRTSSVFGVARAFTTPNWKPALLWWSAIAILSGVLLWQLSLVFINYYSYGVSTVVSESDQNPAFPAITICKTNQMNILRTDLFDWSQYDGFVQQMFQYFPYEQVVELYNDTTTPTQWQYDTVKEYLESLLSYYNALPIDLSVIGDRSPFVVSCQYGTWNRSYIKDCTDWVQLHWDPTYYMCYSISVPEQTAKEISDMTAVLYLNDFDQPSFTDGCCPRHSWSMSSGVRVAVHDRQVPPHMTQAIAVSPGTETNVQISQFDRIRLPPPYPGNCTTTTKLGKTIDNVELGYTSQICEEICLQDFVSNYNSAAEYV